MSRLNLGARRPLSSSMIPALLLALLPLVVMTATAPAAQAATTYGEAAEASFAWHPAFPANDIECAIAGYFAVDGDTVRIEVEGDCKRQLLSDHEDLTIDASDPDGSCSFMSDYEHDSEGGFEMTMTPSALTGILKPADYPSCNITEGCATFIDPDDPATRKEVCFAWALGSPPSAAPPESCVNGRLTAVPTAKKVTSAFGATYGKIDARASLDLPAASAVRLTVWFRYSGQLGQSQSDTKYVGPGPVVVTHAPDGFEASKLGEVVGVQVVLATGVSNLQTPAPGGWAYASMGPWDQSQLRGVDGLSDNYMGGANYPARCSFYYGQKIAQTFGGDTSGTPAGSVDDGSGTGTGGGSSTPPSVEPTAPEDEPDSCGADVSLRDPSTWASGATCLLLKGLGALADLLGQLLDAILGLVDDLLGGLLDLFQALFVPDGDKIDASMARVRDAFDETSPGKWTDSLGSMAPTASAGGCQGPSFTVKIYSINEQVSPFAACSGGMATAANLVKLLLGLGVSIAGGLACIRGITSGLGWEFNLGRGADT